MNVTCLPLDPSHRSDDADPKRPGTLGQTLVVGHQSFELISEFEKEARST